MTLRTMIVDDEPPAVEVLQSLCARSGLVEVIATASEAQLALAQAQELQPDAILLDIGMPGLSGLEVARRLATLRRPPAIVFVTAYDRYAVEAFDLSVVDYVLKPVQFDRLRRALERLDGDNRRSRETGPRAGSPSGAFWVCSRGAMVPVAARDILRIKADRDYSQLHTAERTWILRQPLSTLEARLPAEDFLRVHRSLILRRDQIVGLRHLGSGVWAALDPAGSLHRIGRSHLPAVRQRLGASPRNEGRVLDAELAQLADATGSSEWSKSAHRWVDR